MRRTRQSEPNTVVMGGGHGAATLLEALRYDEGVVSVATVSDDGGSSQKIRNAFGAPPFGDLRRHATALAHKRSLAEFYERRRLDGHARGNIALLDAWQREQGDLRRAVRRVAGELGVRATILPVADNPGIELVMHHAGQPPIRGECAIGDTEVTDPKAYVEISPNTRALPEVIDAIRRTRRLVLPAGSLYTSLAAVLAPEGIREAIEESDAQLIHVANLQLEQNTPPGQHVVDNVRILEQYTGRPFDVVIYNNQAGPNWDAEPLAFDPERFSEISAQAIGAPLAASNGHVLHNPYAVVAQLQQLSAARS